MLRRWDQQAGDTADGGLTLGADNAALIVDDWRNLEDGVQIQFVEVATAIIDAAGSERLQRAYHGLQSEIVLCMVQLQPAYDRPAQVAAEHEELIDAIEARDAGRAERLWRVHLDEAAANQIKALSTAYQTTEEEDV